MRQGPAKRRGRPGLRRAVLARAALGFLALWPAGALAHEADLIYARVERVAGSARLTETLTLSPAALARLAPVDADEDRRLTQGDLDARREAIEAGVWRSAPLYAAGVACSRTSSRARLGERGAELFAVFSCRAGELSQRFRFLDVLAPGYQVALASQVDGWVGQRYASGRLQTVLIPSAAGAAPPKLDGLVGWFVTGARHILTGIDHLAFLAALLLAGVTWRRVLVTTTAFTLAHSITLGATALDLLLLSPRSARWVEVLIAASIVWVAAENLVLERPRRRALLAFAFGLVHGLGFASGLREHGLEDSVVTGLLGFNLGVEAGQAGVVALLFPAVRLVQRRKRARRWGVRAGSMAILAAGGYWWVDRLFGRLFG